MTRFSNKVIYVSLGVLVIFACAPFAGVLEPTPTPVGTALPPAASTQESVNQTQTPTEVLALPPEITSIPEIQLPVEEQFHDLYAYIQAPEGPLAQPYVTLFAFQAIPDISIEITGIVDSKEFVCRGSPCALPVLTSSIVVFRARSSAGTVSEDISATVRVEEGTDGYYVYLDSISRFSAFSDSCLRYWGFQDYTNPQWAQFVQFPYLLNTDKTLHYLVTRLIIHGVVDVSGCPAGGLSAGLDWPTGCGLERSRDTMIEWQNQYDEYIWLASKDVGIPPKILKTLIEVESQFWPGDQRFFVDEIGLGQLNQLGIDVLLRRDPTVYQQVCSAVLDDCSMPYTLRPQQEQAMIRGAFINSLSALCPNCQYGLDLNKAKDSINFIAQVLRANCQTVKIIIDQNTIVEDDEEEEKRLRVIEDPYSDYWKFTLLSYHSGVSCFEQAVKNTPKARLDWENVSANIDCKGGENYVDGVWANLLNFNQYRYTPSDQEIVQVAPDFVPTKTPVPTPVSNYSDAQVQVQTFMDRNQNGTPDDGEWLDDIPVVLQTAGEVKQTGTTVNGTVTFSLGSVVVGTEATVTLQGLYRTETFTVPASGEVSIVFKFDPPVLPTEIP